MAYDELLADRIRKVLKEEEKSIEGLSLKGEKIMEKFTSSKIQGYFQKFAEVTEKFEGLVNPLSNEQFNWKPAKKKWSIAECIDHLNITANLYFPLMNSAIKEGADRKIFVTGEILEKGTFLGRFLLWGLNPNLRLKLPAPGKFSPKQRNYPLERTMEEFRNVQKGFLELLKQCDGLNIGKIRQATPIPITRITLDQAFDILSTHEHRHLTQAQKIQLLLE